MTNIPPLRDRDHLPAVLNSLNNINLSKNKLSYTNILKHLSNMGSADA